MIDSGFLLRISGRDHFELLVLHGNHRGSSLFGKKSKSIHPIQLRRYHVFVSSDDNYILPVHTPAEFPDTVSQCETHHDIWGGADKGYLDQLDRLVSSAPRTGLFVILSQIKLCA